MDPMLERLLFFSIGLVAGLLLRGLFRRRGERTPPRHDDALASAFQPPEPAATAAAGQADPPALSAAEVAAHVRVVDVSAARAAGFNLRHMADLTVVEGIGPKAAELLRAHGIDGFAALAASGAHELREILDQGGPNFRLTNPDDWPQQARLAADNRWAELKALQRARVGNAPPAEPSA